MTLLNKGLKYKLSYKTNRLSNLALEAEAVISLLPSQEQEYIRYQVDHNLQKLKCKIISRRPELQIYINKASSEL
jgi:hypothetical protein